MFNKTTVTLFVVCLFAFASTAKAQLPGLNPLANNPSPELVGQLTKQLSITPQQAIGGSGALFGLAKTKLKPEDFLKVSRAVPGMDDLLKSVPKANSQSNDPLSTLGSALPGKYGALASVAGVFNQLGMSPKMAIKFLPVMGQFVKLKGGSQVADLLSGAWK